MKKQSLSVIRPDVEFEIDGFWGWLLLPYYVLRVLWIGFRLFTFHMLIGRRKVGKLRILSVPKITVKRADAA